MKHYTHKDKTAPEKGRRGYDADMKLRVNGSKSSQHTFGGHLCPQVAGGNKAKRKPSTHAQTGGTNGMSSTIKGHSHSKPLVKPADMAQDLHY